MGIRQFVMRSLGVKPTLFQSDGTSASDGTSYVDACREAASGPLFDTFRRDSRYKVILEHTTPEEGAELAAIAASRFPDYPWDAFRRNDDVGGAEPADCGPAGRMSPSTARYVKILADIETIFGSLDGLDIGEIGAGYGGQARVISARFSPLSYAIWDLEPAAALASRYLGSFGIRVAVHSDIETPPRPLGLVISNYALSEVRRSLQERYLRNVVGSASRGFMFWNAQVFAKDFRADPDAPMLDKEFASLVGGRIIREKPFLTEGDISFGNSLIVWGA